MGREIKRVRQDFKWTLNKVWKGFMNPYHSQDCHSCKNGYTPESQKLSEEWYDHRHPDGDGWGHRLTQDDVQALIDADRLWDFTRIPLNDEQREVVRKKIEDGGNNWLPYSNGRIPTAEEVNEWSRKGIGHDSLNQSICVRERCKRLGIELLCKICEGEGCIWASEKVEKLSENWWDDEKYEPPSGEAYQIWETVSEGSPVSPPFLSPEKLADWMVANDDSICTGTTKEQWLSFIVKEASAITMVARNGEIKSGVADLS